MPRARSQALTVVETRCRPSAAKQREEDRVDDLFKSRFGHRRKGHGQVVVDEIDGQPGDPRGDATRDLDASLQRRSTTHG